MKLFVGAKSLVVYNGKVLVIREAEYDEGTNIGKWDVPGGRIEVEEPILIGLTREVKEESGLEITPGEVLGVFETFPTIKSEPCHIIRVYYRGESHSDQVVLGTDHDTYEWIDPKNYTPREFVSDIEELIVKVAKTL
jgi:8-oxo-dGTP diphosphatase